jgi:hypothetical protein
MEKVDKPPLSSAYHLDHMLALNGARDVAGGIHHRQEATPIDGPEGARTTDGHANTCES